MRTEWNFTDTKPGAMASLETSPDGFRPFGKGSNAVSPSLDVSSQSAALGRRLSRSVDLRFVDETEQHYTSRREERAAQSRWACRHNGVTGIVDVKRFVFSHPLLTSEGEREAVWSEISKAPGAHLELLKALSRGDSNTFDRLLYSTITQAKFKYDEHFDFWVKFFTRQYERQVAEMLSEDPHFLVTSMSGVDPRQMRGPHRRLSSAAASSRHLARRHSAGVVPSADSSPGFV